MFLFRVKVEELDARRLSSLKTDIESKETDLREHCPIREMNIVTDAKAAHSELDIYLALDDVIDSLQLRALFGQLRAMIAMNLPPRDAPAPRISSELIHI